MKSLSYIKFITFFPLTGIFGYQRYLLWNNGVFFGRLLLFMFVLFISAISDNPNFISFGLLLLVCFWMYDLFNITKIYNKSIDEIDKTVDDIVNFGLNGEYKKMFLKLSKNAKTKVYINRMIETGKGEKLMKKFATSENEINEIMSIISRRDDIAAMNFFRKKVGDNFLSFLK